MLLSAKNITKSFLDETVLSNINLDIKEDDRIGLLGVNGAGKTTLLNILAGSLDADSGTISKNKATSIGYLRQNDALDTSNTIKDEARKVFSRIYDIKKKINDCYKHLETDAENPEFIDKLAKLTTQFDALDGYHVEDKITRVLTGLGFGDFDRNTEISTLSGGEKMRFGIAQMLLRQPDLLILDEPTNHLDFTMLKWLEDYLSSYKGAILVVSHDRYFLDAIAQNIWEIEFTELTKYKGGYSSFVTQKNEQAKTAMRAWEKQQEEIKQMEEFVRKNLAKSASVNGVGSRVKQLEKMERLPKPRSNDKTIKLKFTYKTEPFESVLRCSDLSVTVGEGSNKKLLFENVDLEIRRGEKVAIIGKNGIGKSSFLKAIQGKIPYLGEATWGGNVRIGYFSQELEGLDMESTAIDAVHSAYPLKTSLEIRSALARLLLEGEDVFKKIKELSGANRAKVVFTILLMRNANVLIFDEPTNHLDYKAKEQLEQALADFTGTLIIVSHDRYFLKRVPGKILELLDDGFVEYIGNYDYYLEKKTEADMIEQQRLLEEKRKQISSDNNNYKSKQQRAEEAQRRNLLTKAETRIAELEQIIEDCNADMQNPDFASNHEKLIELSKTIEKSSAELEDCMATWLELNE